MNWFILPKRRCNVSIELTFKKSMKICVTLWLFRQSLSYQVLDLVEWCIIFPIFQVNLGVYWDPY